MILSGETAKDHAPKHPEAIGAYALVQEMLDNPSIVVQEDAFHFGVVADIEIDGKVRTWKVSFKKTHDGLEIFLSNLQRLRPKSLRQYLNKKGMRIILDKRK